MREVTFNNFVQVAGIIDQNEADLLVEAGVHYLGFPLRLPVNKEDLIEQDAKRIIDTITPPFFAVVISYSKTADEALSICRKLGAKILQLHGPITLDQLEKIKNRAPEIFIIKSLVVYKDNELELIDIMKNSESYVDAFITDTFDPETGASGATGKIHNWEISKRLVSYSVKPLILAGGLNPDNVYEAIIKVKPAGVDVHTGVENSSGRKDKGLVNKFLNEARRAFEEIKNEY